MVCELMCSRRTFSGSFCSRCRWKAGRQRRLKALLQGGEHIRTDDHGVIMYARAT
ncbi:hypothetical protein Plhal304r1_c002g0004941 [Plasmopara halstedii]